MTTVQRAYINPSYEQYVDDGCLEWKSVPMAVVKDVLKVSHHTNEYDGIKQVYNTVPPRPKNINAMATSVARINQLTYSSAVPLISKKFIDEETQRVRSFVSSAPPEYDPAVPEMRYSAEQPVRSSSGERLVPATTREMIDNPKYSRVNTATMILGDVEPTSGVVPFNMDMEVQTEWIMNKEDGYMKRDIVFGNVEALAYEKIGGMGMIGQGGQVGETSSRRWTETNRVGHYREGVSVQTELTKPPSGKYIERGTSSEKARFFENPEDRFGTITGTPTSRLGISGEIRRTFIGEPARRPNFAGDSATSGLNSQM